jgi:hypothetical protein
MKRVNMAKAKTKRAAIPKFSSEAEEAAWWDKHRSEIEIEIRRRIKQRKPLTLSSLLQKPSPRNRSPSASRKRTWTRRAA